jgi:protein-S-isoprenylcysteine O-methyltransferase
MNSRSFSKTVDKDEAEADPVISDNLSTNLSEHYFVHVHSVTLSFVPVAVALLVYSTLMSDLNITSTFLYVLLITALLMLSNIIAFMSLSSIVRLNIYWRSSLLANAFLIGFMLAGQQRAPTLISFGYYMMSMSFFHLSEYVFTALFNHKQISTDSFLLNHSIEYGLAAMASWLEFSMESFLFPSLKTNIYARTLGLIMVLGGETFRKLAMYTAGSSFNHYVQEQRSKDHVLVQSGIYSLVRHPSYFGWFYWSIGTQILLGNPLCTILYTLVSWRFFKSRIVYEEFYLLKFFGKRYAEYQRSTPSGIPFVKGYVHADEALD